jgi:hypothetical protein
MRRPDPEEEADHRSKCVCPFYACDAQELFHHLGMGVLFVM